jgi:thiol-disulfide isomerase/thioredoxin
MLLPALLLGGCADSPNGVPAKAVAQTTPAAGGNETASKSSPAEPAQEAQAEQPAAENREPNGAGGEEGQEAAGNDAAPRPGEDDEPADPAEPVNPFQHRIPMPEFPAQLEWLNSRPMKLEDLRGKFVLLDFWTYCCINCMHVLPELKKLEEAYPNELVVIGVHSAKFENEKLSENIAEAILRYEIEHPVMNDLNHEYWNRIGISSWPTILLIDPEGNAIWAKAGEFEFAQVDQVMQIAVEHYTKVEKLDRTPLRFELLRYNSERTPLRYPGKVIADGEGNRLFIADSNHNRLLITDLSGKLLATIGSGEIGAADGSYDQCSFNRPQGMALHGETLYVADTENHLLRKIDLRSQEVTTIAGTGKQGRIAWPGLEGPFLLPGDLPENKRWVGPPRQTAINSPWDLLVHEADLYIAMAGPIRSGKCRSTRAKSAPMPAMVGKTS